MNIFLRARQWQLFVLSYGFSIILYFGIGLWLIGSFMDYSMLGKASVIFNILPIVNILHGIIYFGWMYSVGTKLHFRLPAQFRLNLSTFQILIFILAAFYLFSILLGVIFMNNLISGLRANPSYIYWYYPLNVIALGLRFYLIYFVSRTLKTLEVNHQLSFSSYAAEFFAILFLPIGIWIIQPRINKIAGTEEPNPYDYLNDHEIQSDEIQASPSKSEQRIFESVDQYILDLFGTEDPDLKASTKSLTEAGIPDASISPVQGQLLQVFAAACHAKRILELGTLGGYSTLWFAKSIPADGKVITIEYDELHASLAQSNFDQSGLGHKIDLRIGKAMDILEDMIAQQEAPFDLIFIDADKEPYELYFKSALQLARPGTIIICDNVIRNGKVLDPDSSDEKVKGVQRLNQFLGQCKSVTATILQTVGAKEYDGMAIAVVNQEPVA